MSELLDRSRSYSPQRASVRPGSQIMVELGSQKRLVELTKRTWWLHFMPKPFHCFFLSGFCYL